MPAQANGEIAIAAEAVRKTYRFGLFNPKSVEALRGIDLAVPSGKIFGLLGPNGAGKTTLINIFAGQLEPDSGRIYVLGRELSGFGCKALRGIKTSMNMCSGAPNFPWSFTVFEVLNFYGMLYGMSGRERKKKINEYIGIFGLGTFRESPFDSLSSGTKQKVALAKALLNEPRILFLDEPTIGLDPDIAIRIRTFITEINRSWKNTVILSTHYMREAEELCERIAFIRDGRIVAQGTSEELKRLTSSSDLEEVFLELSRSDFQE